MLTYPLCFQGIPRPIETITPVHHVLNTFVLHTADFRVGCWALKTQISGENYTIQLCETDLLYKKII